MPPLSTSVLQSVQPAAVKHAAEAAHDDEGMEYVQDGSTPPCPPCILDNLPHGCPRAQIAFEVRGWHCVDFVSCAALQACSHRSYSVILYAESQWRTQCFGHIWPMNGAGHFGLPTWLANAYLERAGLHGECHASSSFRFAGSCWLWVAAPSRLCLSAGFGDGI